MNHEEHEEHEDEKIAFATHIFLSSGETDMGEFRVESPLTTEQEELIRQIIGACIEVHSRLGPGFLEKIYEKAMDYELKATDLKIGLLINFKVKLLKNGGIKRILR